MNRRLQHDVGYIIRMEPGVQTPEQTLEIARGSCRDSAWLLVQLLRHLGLAARFVSGYLIQLTPDVKALDGPVGASADFTDLHAWCEVYLPGAGWIGLDPTSGLLAGEGHIPLSCTPEPASAAPITGAVDECDVEFHHAMSVARVFESPRVTKPYTDDQWNAMVDLGHEIDRELQKHDVRLTMGGEPTFVSSEDRDGDEWNTTALGPTKRFLAADLLWRLRRRYGVNGFVHFGQGKWYPGEQLPRWALGCYWRRDGEPSWQDADLVRQRTRAGGPRIRGGRAIHSRADDAPSHHGRARAARYEDLWYYLWRERRLPVNVDPFDAKLDDERERERLRRVFSQGLGATVGFALPLERNTANRGPRWRTGPWFLRDDRLFLTPGDSPMGYRLPLDSLPWTAAVDRASLEPLDPTAPRQAFAPYASLRSVPSPRLQPSRIDPGTPTTPTRGESARGHVRTALCAEARNGVLYLFMPPLSTADAYLELVAAIEATAADLGMPVLLEGYPPPHDPRLAELLITPDPGVIEVNIQPARSWTEVVEQTTTAL